MDSLVRNKDFELSFEEDADGGGEWYQEESVDGVRGYSIWHHEHSIVVTHRHSRTNFVFRPTSMPHEDYSLEIIDRGRYDLGSAAKRIAQDACSFARDGMRNHDDYGFHGSWNFDCDSYDFGDEQGHGSMEERHKMYRVCTRETVVYLREYLVEALDQEDAAEQVRGADFDGQWIESEAEEDEDDILVTNIEEE